MLDTLGEVAAKAGDVSTDMYTLYMQELQDLSARQAAAEGAGARQDALGGGLHSTSLLSKVCIIKPV